MILLFIFVNQKPTHKTITGRAIYQAKEIYYPGEKLTGNILFNLRKGESIPKDTKVKISLGDFKEEFILADFVNHQPVFGKIYAENSQISGEGMVFGIPGKKRTYQNVEFQLEIYEEEIQEPAEETTPSSGKENELQENPQETATITGEAIAEIAVKTISGTTSKNSPFTYELEKNQKARIVSGSVKSNGEKIPENEISLKTEGNILSVTTEYALEEQGFGPEFLGEENALTFKINVEDLNLKATADDLVIEISYEGKEIAYYKETILVAKKPEKPTTPVSYTHLTLPTIYSV